MDAEQQSIIDLIRSIFVAFDRGDTDAIEDALDEDATVWDVFTPHLIRGRAERDAFHAADQAQKIARGPLRWELGEPLIDVLGEVAVARYLLEFSYAPPNAAAGSIRITDVLRRRDGRWRVIHHHEGLVPDGVPPLEA